MVGGALGKVEEGCKSSKIVSVGYLTSFLRGRNLLKKLSKSRILKKEGAAWEKEKKEVPPRFASFGVFSRKVSRSMGALHSGMSSSYPSWTFCPGKPY